MNTAKRIIWPIIALLRFQRTCGFSLLAGTGLFSYKRAQHKLAFCSAVPGQGGISPNKGTSGPQNRPNILVLDDLNNEGTRNWYFFADTVMGGVSSGSMARTQIEGRPGIKLQGSVSLENNGGFIQIAMDFTIPGPGNAFDAGGWEGLEIDIYGDGQSYNLHLRTDDVQRVFQSYRYTFATKPREWHTIRIPFSAFTPYRIDVPLNVTRLRRLGVVAIGREMEANIAVGGVRLYRG